MLFNTKIIILFKQTLGTIQSVSYQCKTLDVCAANVMKYLEKGKRGLQARPLQVLLYCTTFLNIFKQKRRTCLLRPLYGGGGGQQKVYKVAGRLWWRCLEETRRSCIQKGVVLSSGFLSLHWRSWSAIYVTRPK